MEKGYKINENKRFFVFLKGKIENDYYFNISKISLVIYFESKID